MRSYNKKFVYFICLVSAMGGLLFGYDWVVIGNLLTILQITESWYLSLKQNVEREN